MGTVSGPVLQTVDPSSGGLKMTEIKTDNPVNGIKWMKDYPDLCDKKCKYIHIDIHEEFCEYVYEEKLYCKLFTEGETATGYMDVLYNWIQLRHLSCKRLTRHLVD